MKLFIDFDSTFTKVEALDKLAQIALSENKEKDQIIKKIIDITNLGMEGKMNFSESLKSRLELLNFSKNHLDILIEELKKEISDSIILEKDFFIENSPDIYIISGGFKEFIYPVVKDFGILEDHVLANEFIFNGDQVVGFDQDNFLAHDLGKVKQIQSLGLDGEKIMVGDGWTDYQVKEEGVVDYFIAYIENIKRENVINKANFVANNWREIINYLNK